MNEQAKTCTHMLEHSSLNVGRTPFFQKTVWRRLPRLHSPNLLGTLSAALHHRDGNSVELAYSDARHRKKGGASIVSAAMHTNSPTPSAITMSPIVSIASPLHISETAKIPFALAMQTSLPSGRSVRAAIAFAEKKAIAFFPGDSPTEDGARGKPMPALHRWRCCSSTLNWERQYGRHAAPPRHKA